jgi:B-cell receptor-associated protein 31
MEIRFVAILFADALQRMFRITAESDMAKSVRGGVISDVRSDTNLAAKKF